jgi:hypothetical protein
MKRNLLLLVGVFALGSAVLYYSTGPVVVKTPGMPQPHSGFSEETSAPLPTPAAPPLQTTTLTETLREKIEKYKPGKDTEYRKALEENPHQTPPVVLVSAIELSEIFHRVKTESEATEAFEFFSNCVSKEGVIALQTSCLRYAKKLTQSYPSLRSQWSGLEASASNEAKEILKLDSI